MRGPYREAIDLPFSEVSEGQRALIALYMLVYCALTPDRTLLIDEPDNFIALAEIQPWLMKLLDRVDETNGQVILVSHHPELWGSACIPRWRVAGQAQWRRNKGAAI